jgi:phosphinothricin acetyltransferase
MPQEESAPPPGRTVVIAPLAAGDWPAAREIYREGIATRNSTFENSAPEWETWDRGHLPGCRLVARIHTAATNRDLLGWAALSPVSSRCVYAGVAEASVYVAARAHRQGVGQALLAALIEASERDGIWTLQAGIFPENAASLHLFQKLGFRIVGVRERLGSMEGRWRDVALLERRSAVAGISAV